MDASPDEDFVTEQLDLFVPDLLARKQEEAFVRRLFAAEKGKWLSVWPLCAGLPKAEAALRAITPKIQGELMVVWLDHPTEPDYAYVHFYLPDFFWTMSATYNRAILKREDPCQASES
jgi:hypothetical protein